MNKTAIGATVIVSIAVLGLVALLPTSPSEPSYSQVPLNQIKGLKDCQMFAIEANTTRLYVVRCPNSETSVHWVEGGKKYFVDTAS